MGSVASEARDFCFLHSSCQVRSSLLTAMEAYFNTYLTDKNEQVVKDVTAHLAETGVSRPTDLGFLCRASGEVSAGMVRLGCPQWWTAEHFDILRRAIEAQAANRHGVVALALLELAPPTGGRVDSKGSPPAAVRSNNPLPGMPAPGGGNVSTGTPPAAVGSRDSPPGPVNDSADYMGSGPSSGGRVDSKGSPPAAVRSNNPLPAQSLCCSLAEMTITARAQSTGAPAGVVPTETVAACARSTGAPAGVVPTETLA